jgi:hypothetical protein
MANTPFNTSGFIISYPPVAASSFTDITGLYNEVVTSAQPSSSLLNINGTNICLFTSSISVPNTSDTVFVEIADGQDLITTLTAVTTAFNASSSIYPNWNITDPYSPLTATDDGASTLTITAVVNDPNGNNYTLDNKNFSGNVLSAISGQFAGFTALDSSTIVSFIDYSGTQLVDSTNWILNTGITIPLYHSQIEISAGTLLLYPLSTAIPQI